MLIRLSFIQTETNYIQIFFRLASNLLLIVTVDPSLIQAREMRSRHNRCSYCRAFGSLWFSRVYSVAVSHFNVWRMCLCIAVCSSVTIILAAIVLKKMRYFFVQCAFSVNLAVSETIKQNGCYDYVLELSYATASHCLRNIIRDKKKSLLSLDCMKNQIYFILLM
jgi:hypothetical protein